jgi:hypothetical protein
LVGDSIIMAKVNYIHNSFNAGIFSPRLYGRTDLEKYFSGVEECENFILKPYGGVERRPGTYFVAEVKTSSKSTRLIPFQYSTTQAYVIEMGDQYMRFYKDNGQITDSGSAVEIATPYLEAELFDVQFAQSADTLYLAHPNHAPRKLTRSSHTSWTLTTVDFFRGPMLDTNSTTTTMSVDSNTGNDITITASAAYFDEDMVGALFRIKDGYVKLDTYTDTTHMKGDVQENADGSAGDLNTSGAETDWAEGAWSDYRGYPSCVTFYEQRLFFANTKHQPQTVWGSVSNDYENFETGAEDDDSLNYTIGSGQVNAIKWMMPGKVMAIGTAGGSFTLSSGSDAQPLTPSNVVVRRDVTYGSDDIVPVQIGNFVYFVQRNSRTLREFGYSFEVDAYQALDMTLLAEQITEGGIEQMEYQQSPNNVLWCVTGEGNLACLTRQIPQKVIGWSEVKTDGDYESVAVIPADEEDEVWTIVNRTIDGSTVRYIEYFKPFEIPSEQEDCFYVDCGLSLDSPYSISSITQADPAVVTTSSAHGLSNGDTVIIRGVEGMTEVNKKRYLAASVTSDTFELQTLAGDDVDSSSYVAYSSGGEVRKCVETVSGLSHLEGETVSVLADGAVHPDVTVTSGAISLNWKAGEIHAGLPYDSILKTLRLEGGSQMGSSQAVVKRITDVTVRMYRSLGCTVGTEDSQDIIPFRSMGDSLDEPTPLYTGDKKILMPNGYDKEGQIYIKQAQPLPLNITAIISKVSVLDS